MSDDRREAVRDQQPPTLNAIDFLEVDPSDETKLVVHFIFNLPDAPVNPVPPGAPGEALIKDDFVIDGGERIADISVVSATRTADNQLTVIVDRVGDFSTYTLRLRLPNGQTPPGFDPQLASVDFIFHVECARRFDCKPVESCPPVFAPAPQIDYLAKDYPGFVRVMLDRLSLLVPEWRERNPTDLGIAVVEMLAYVADHLSYRHDTIGTEAYLDTARFRTSIRRHARLVDYHIDEGSNARVWLRLTMNADLPAGIPMGTRFATAFGEQTPPRLDHTYLAYRQATEAGVTFFETVADSGPLLVDHNEIELYNWRASEMCLAVGATQATLRGSHPGLKRDTFLVLGEKKGPRTGDTADADPSKRQCVRLTEDAIPDTDPLDGTPITEIRWQSEDALTQPICVSSIADSEHKSAKLVGVSVAWGNIMLGDHGRTLGDPLEAMPESVGTVPDAPAPRFRPRLAEGPLTFLEPHPADTSAAGLTKSMPAIPRIDVRSTDPDGNLLEWSAARDLLDPEVAPESFVVEVERDGTAYLRFGDGTNGMLPPRGAEFQASYRVGNGKAGNVGRDSVVLIDTTQPNRAAIRQVTNPLPAFGGRDPETIDHVRQSAPAAFRTQERAVTQDDFGNRAEQYAGVQRAAATFRWTGSWYTVFPTIERASDKRLDPSFIDALTGYLDRYRMAGFDIQVDDAHRVPMLVEMHVCVVPDAIAADVETAMRAVFSNRVLRDGTMGVFHPDRLNLGEPFYLSPLYERAQSLDGVESVRIVRFEREGQPSDDGLLKGVLVPDRLEMFVLDNDPSFPERGRFELHVEGGV